ncbi:hypothetical protein LSAT2_009026 [Lamellibrachia satsuma]|nr:hypothetical protein LSAT2_009026 [Lamellibrachia satsuma]
MGFCGSRFSAGFIYKDHQLCASKIGWDANRQKKRENNMNATWIKEAIWIRKTTPIMNPVEGNADSVTRMDGLLATPTGTDKENIRFISSKTLKRYSSLELDGSLLGTLRAKGKQKAEKHLA